MPYNKCDFNTPCDFRKSSTVDKAIVWGWPREDYLADLRQRSDEKQGEELQDHQSVNFLKKAFEQNSRKSSSKVEFLEEGRIDKYEIWIEQLTDLKFVKNEKFSQ